MWLMAMAHVVQWPASGWLCRSQCCETNCLMQGFPMIIVSKFELWQPPHVVSYLGTELYRDGILIEISGIWHGMQSRQKRCIQRHFKMKL
jgi:hypothetical protein